MDQNDNMSIEKRKLINVLYELSKETFNMSDDTILEKLHEQIARKAENDFFELSRDFGVWLECVFNLWNNNIISSSVKVFAVRLFGLVGSKPYSFSTIKHMLPTIIEFVLSSEGQNDACLMVPLLNNLGLFLNHDEGFDWVLKSGVWKHVVKCFYEDHSIYIHRSAVQFISLLLSKANNDSKHGVEIFNFICKPIMHNHLLTLEPLPDLKNHLVFLLPAVGDKQCVVTKLPGDQIERLWRFLKYLCEILDELFKIGSDLPVKLKCTFFIRLTSHKCPFCPSIQDYQLFYQLAFMLRLFSAVNLTKTKIKTKMPSGPSGLLSCSMGDISSLVCAANTALSTLTQFHKLVDFSVFCLSRIHSFKLKYPKICLHQECKDCSMLEKTLFSLLDYFLQLHYTCFCGDYCIKVEERCIKNQKEFRTRKDALSKKFRKSLTEGGPPPFQQFQSLVNALDRIVKFINFTPNRSHLSAELLKCFDSLLFHCKSQDNPTFRRILLQLIVTANQLLDKRSYRFEEEILDLSFIIRTILENEKDNSRVTISTLQLASKVIKEHVLLHLPPIQCEVDDIIGLNKSILDCFLSPLKESLKNPSSWEIRDTALEVYQSAVDVGDTSPSIVCNLFKGNVFKDIFEIAAKDVSSYVRSSCFRLLGKAMITRHYADELPSKDLSDLAIKTLLEDDMPEPRMAACDLLAAMYVTDHLKDPDMPEKLFDTIYISSMKELDWEVKKATLRFWQCTVSKHLADKGVPLDAVYLQSSTHRNNEGMVLEIIKVMDILSAIGCLKAVWSDLVDDTEISVSEAASEVINNFINLDRQWDFIDQILNDRNVKEHGGKMTEKFFGKEDFFRNIRDNSWRDKLSSRKNWIENSCDDLSSLLDHILTSNSEDWDHNAIDCY